MPAMIIVSEKNENGSEGVTFHIRARLFPERGTTMDDIICRPSGRPAHTPTQTVACCHLATGTQNIARGPSAELVTVLSVSSVGMLTGEILLFASYLPFLCYLSPGNNISYLERCLYHVI